MTAIDVRSEIAPEGDQAVMQVYDRAASRYDLVNDLLSFGTSNWYRRRTILSLELPEDATLVDVGSGTGALARAAQRFLPASPGIVAVDPSAEMRSLAVQAGVRDVRPGSFESIPVADRSMDAVVSGYAIRYVEDFATAFAEIRRVMRPGGRLVLLEMIVPARGFRRTLARFLIHGVAARVLPLICGSRATGDLLRHFWNAISSFDPPQVVTAALVEAGFEEVEYRHVGGLLGEFRARVSDV
ncbi:MAG: dimethylmenaquinone methyltransferase [Phycisphaerae bacterium]|nr:dimethylmenaquinone methyltransferase [Phycisphaerae bacterium]OUX00479.1 MAG: hypothetical protein CBD91_06545 [Phycisphaeraceae bacterium TMED231]